MPWLILDGTGGLGWLVVPLVMIAICIFMMTVGRRTMRGMGSMCGMRSMASSERRRPAREDPREIARRAYAQGELDREQYLQIMSDLDEHAAPAHQRRSS